MASVFWFAGGIKMVPGRFRSSPAQESGAGLEQRAGLLAGAPAPRRSASLPRAAGASAGCSDLPVLREPGTSRSLLQGSARSVSQEMLSAPKRQVRLPCLVSPEEHTSIRAPFPGQTWAAVAAARAGRHRRGAGGPGGAPAGCCGMPRNVPLLPRSGLKVPRRP